MVCTSGKEQARRQRDEHTYDVNANTVRWLSADLCDLAHTKHGQCTSYDAHETCFSQPTQNSKVVIVETQ